MAKKTPEKCKHCGRLKGDRKVSKCRRCPHIPIRSRVMSAPVRSLTLLANDPGAKAGISLFHLGDVVSIEKLDPWGVRPTGIARTAQLLSEEGGTDLALVGEDWGVGGAFATPATMVGLAQTWGIVRREALLHGAKASRIWRMPTATWRSFHGGPIGQKYFDWKAWAVDLATELAGFPITNDNAAESYLIGHAALRLPETLDRATRRARKACGELSSPVYAREFPEPRTAPRARRRA